MDTTVMISMGSGNTYVYGNVTSCGVIPKTTILVANWERKVT